MAERLDTDGLLSEWGSRLFYPAPKKPKGQEERFTLPAWSAMPASAVRAQLRALVQPGAVQVVVRITGGGRGMNPIAAHMRYIARQGKPEVGGRGQTLELEDERGIKLQGIDDIKGLIDDWRLAGSYLPDESPRREAFNIVLSMPAGTPPDAVLGAARDFARETFEGHKYVFALHEDTDEPHVHLAVRAERLDGHRLNPRKRDLEAWRARFAERLQDRGINAVATRAASRGVRRASPPLWRVHAGRQGRERKPSAGERSAESVSRAGATALQAWQEVARALAQSSVPDDRSLVAHVLRYVRQAFGREPSREQAAEQGRRSRGPRSRQGRDLD